MTVPQFVDDIEALRIALNIDKMNLMGHSWGGLLALFYALQHPDRLKSLILISTSGASSDYLQPMSQSILSKRTDGEWAGMARLESTPGFSRNPALVEQWYKIYFRPYFFDAEDANNLEVKLTRQSVDTDALGYFLRALGVYDIHARLDSIRVPTLIVHGKQDPLPAWCSERIHEHIPGSELHLIDRCGHFPYIEQPDTLAAIFRRFMNR
jgi:proline iminopeptidase